MPKQNKSPAVPPAGIAPPLAELRVHTPPTDQGLVPAAPSVVDLPATEPCRPETLSTEQASNSLPPAAIPELQIHDVAKLFPKMTPAEYEAFKNDIATGNRPTPTVWTHEEKIIDGRHGYQACRELGRVPEIRQWNGEGSVLSFVVALNLNRRQLTSAQRACVATEIEVQLAEEAAARRRRGKAAEPTQSVGEADEQNDRHAGEAAEQAARIAGTNRDYVAKAKKLRGQWPALFEDVRSGRVELPEADRSLRAALVELKEQAPELHAKVVGGKKTIPEARVAAKRLPQNASPAPSTAATRPAGPAVADDPPEPVGAFSDDASTPAMTDAGPAPTATIAPGKDDAIRRPAAEEGSEAVPETARPKYATGHFEVEDQGTARVTAPILGQVSPLEGRRPLRIFRRVCAGVHAALAEGVPCLLLPELAEDWLP